MDWSATLLKLRDDPPRFSAVGTVRFARSQIGGYVSAVPAGNDRLATVQSVSLSADVLTMQVWSFTPALRCVLTHTVPGSANDAKYVFSTVHDKLNTLEDLFATLGDEPTEAEVVIHEVDHAEPPSQVDPVEASLIQEEIWASRAERNIQEYNLLTQENLADDRVHDGRDKTYNLVLHFDRCPQHLEDALLASPLAKSALSQGVDIKPSWARGAKIFGLGVLPEHVEAPCCEALGPWVVIIPAISPNIDQAKLDHDLGLTHLPVRYKKLKPHKGSSLIPGKLSLLDVSSAGERQSVDDAVIGDYAMYDLSTDSESEIQNATWNHSHEIPIQVRFTFVQFDEYVNESGSRSQSCPPYVG